MCKPHGIFCILKVIRYLAPVTKEASRPSSGPGPTDSQNDEFFAADLEVKAVKADYSHLHASQALMFFARQWYDFTKSAWKLIFKDALYLFI